MLAKINRQGSGRGPKTDSILRHGSGFGPNTLIRSNAAWITGSHGPGGNGCSSSSRPLPPPIIAPTKANNFSRLTSKDCNSVCVVFISCTPLLKSKKAWPALLAGDAIVQGSLARRNQIGARVNGDRGRLELHTRNGFRVLHGMRNACF